VSTIPATGTTTEYASEFPPGLKDFHYAPLAEFHLFGIDFAITKLTILTWVVVLGLSLFFLLAVRRQQMVPGRLQWAGESVYGFIRDGMARPMIGDEGVRFAPYLTTLFCFVLFNNLWAVIPVAQISPTAKISLPLVLALATLVLFNWVGIKKQGAKKYFGAILWPTGAPWWILPLLAPIELIQVFLVRPVTLAVRLFANMFAGHLLLLVFTLGGVALLDSSSLFSQSVSVVSFAFAIVMTLFEFVVQLVQAYVFTILTASYLQGALADEH
jgi:F-type H+-transporting ATPase subunit a